MGTFVRPADAGRCLVNALSITYSLQLAAMDSKDHLQLSKYSYHFQTPIH